MLFANIINAIIWLVILGFGIMNIGVPRIYRG